VTVQVRSSDAACAQAVFSSNEGNGPETFVARGD